MRVLSLGCHDGFVEMWLLDQLPDLEVDGVELHPHAVEVANRRGINCVQGRAEDAVRLFTPGTYDAVVAYELIEHVLDVDVLLDTCESMVKPGGKIFLSTPEGTFGEGNNPHHLRAYTSVAFADLLRRRGKLCDFMVGLDGITVGVYTPAPRRGEVAIVTGPTIPWHPMDIEAKGLGGSETAAYRIGAALSELGYVVTLYGQFTQSGAMKDLLLRDWQTFDPSVHRQAVIVSRMPELFDRKLNAEQKLFWVHDTDYGDRLTEERAESMDKVLALSSWHAEHLIERYPFVAEKIALVRNGIEPGYYKPDPELEREKRVVYSSSPDRGLDIVLEVWPEVLERVPDAQLTYCYPDYFTMAAEQSPKLAAFKAKLDRLSEQPNVHSAGSLALPALSGLLRSSLCWVHPSYNTPGETKFNETFCIGALEAQACGCAVVAGDWGALHETVSVGRLIEGDPTTVEWRAHFLDSIVQALTDESVQQIAQTVGPAEVAQADWKGAGELFAALVEPG